MDVRKTTNIVLALGVVAALLFSPTSKAAAAGPVTGAIFTTNIDGSFVNGNVYDNLTDVYLNGGPRPNAPCSAAGLPDGPYYFQVTDPSGWELLTDVGPGNGVLKVAGGVIAEYIGNRCSSQTLGNCFGDLPPYGQCGSVMVQLSPNSTTNPGNEYKVWMTPVDAYNLYGSFLPKYSKTDNFKVLSPICVEGQNC